MSTPSADIFFGYYLGKDEMWANDDDCAELPGVIVDDLIPSNAPVCIVLGGSYEDGGMDYSLAIKASLTSTDWDSNPKGLGDTPIMSRSDGMEADYYATLRAWADKLDISWEKIEQANPSGPRWLIVTSTG